MTLDSFLSQQKQSILNSPVSGVSFRDIEIICAEVLGLSDVEIITQSKKILTQEEIKRALDLLEHRFSGQSISELFQKKQFFGEEFFVTNDVLTPRPETECVVKKALELLSSGNHISRVIDVGTGSGCIITSIANSLPQFSGDFLGVDIAPKALEVAKQNIQKIRKNTEQKIVLRASDLLENISAEEISNSVIVTNLPYIPSQDANWMEKEVLEGDPHLALFSGEEGLDLYSQFFLQLKQKHEYLENNNLPSFFSLVFEYDPPQTEFFQKFLTDLFPSHLITFFPDLSGQIRFGVIE